MLSVIMGTLEWLRDEVAQFAYGMPTMALQCVWMGVFSSSERRDRDQAFWNGLGMSVAQFAYGMRTMALMYGWERDGGLASRTCWSGFETKVAQFCIRERDDGSAV